MNATANMLPFDDHSLQLAAAYMTAKETVIEKGYAHEIDWQETVSFERITETQYLKESAWVILSAGMKETVVRQKFTEISRAFCEWESARKVIEERAKCHRLALEIFRNNRKITAILDTANLIVRTGFQSVKARIEEGGVEAIQEMPFMGPATSRHLAKNLGMLVAKPDRHLVRAAKYAGCQTPTILCEKISSVVGDKISVVDIVIWRYATLNRSNMNIFSALGGSCPTHETEVIGHTGDGRFCDYMRGGW